MAKVRSEWTSSIRACGLARQRSSRAAHSAPPVRRADWRGRVSPCARSSRRARSGRRGFHAATGLRRALAMKTSLRPFSNLQPRRPNQEFRSKSVNIPPRERKASTFREFSKRGSSFPSERCYAANHWNRAER